MRGLGHVWRIRMPKEIRDNLQTIVVVTIVGFILCAVALSFVHNSAAHLSVAAFDTLVIVIPCAIMFIGSLVIAFTAKTIGPNLFFCLVIICLALGIVSMVVTSIWMGDSNIANALLANSKEGTEIIPITKSPLIGLRNIAAFFVMPTVGLIFGAWLGSRFHSVSSTKQPKAKKKRR